MLGFESLKHPNQFRALGVGAEAQHFHNAAAGEQRLGDGDVGLAQPADSSKMVEEGREDPALGVRHPLQQLGRSAPRVAHHQPVLDVSEHIAAAKFGYSRGLRVGERWLVAAAASMSRGHWAMTGW